MEWRDIKGFEGYYQVSSKGEIKSLELILQFGMQKRTKPESIVKVHPNNSGYLCVSLHRDGTRYSKKVHRIVAETFIENPNNYAEVNHIDLDKYNNCVDNLEWASHSLNMKHAYKNGKVLNFIKKLTKENVDEIRKLNTEGNYKRKELAKMFNIGVMQISRIINNKNWIES